MDYSTKKRGDLLRLQSVQVLAGGGGRGARHLRREPAHHRGLWPRGLRRGPLRDGRVPDARNARARARFHRGVEQLPPLRAVVGVDLDRGIGLEDTVRPRHPVVSPECAGGIQQVVGGVGDGD